MDNNTLDAVFDCFQNLYPQWVNYLFDEQFLHTSAAPLLASAHNITPLDLAQAWADQIHWQDDHIRQRRIDEVLPATTHFLQLWLLAEAHNAGVDANFHFQPFVFVNNA